MYSNTLKSIVKEYLICITYTFENSMDTGEVSRDLSSAFWKITYVKHFDGEKLLDLNHNTELATPPLVGMMMCCWFMACGYLPVQIEFPIMAAVLKGLDTIISDDITC